MLALSATVYCPLKRISTSKGNPLLGCINTLETQRMPMQDVVTDPITFPKMAIKSY